MKNFIIAVQFLTRISVGPTLEISSEDMGSSASAYPLVGSLLAFILVSFALILRQLSGLPIIASATFLTVGEILLTGGLHLDGLMDCADGLLSYRPREQILAIMKDSTVGANAVLALVSLLLVKISLLIAVLPDYLWVLLVMPLISRWNLLYLAVYYPYAGKKGSLGGSVIGQAGKKEFFKGTFWALILTVLSAGLALWWGRASLGFIILSFALAWLTGIFTAWSVAQRATEKIGGITGDVLGAVVELTEVAVLLTFVVFSSFAG